MIVVFEGLILSFWLLLICVVGMAKEGPVGLVLFYEQEVQDRVIELGLTSKERIKKTSIISGLAMWIPMLIVIPAIVHFYNGASGFLDHFIQLTIIYLIEGLSPSSRIVLHGISICLFSGMKAASPTYSRRHSSFFV